MNIRPKIDLPFAVPADVVIDLPPPISVNQTRRVDLSTIRKRGEWTDAADALVTMAKRRQPDPLKLIRIPRFEIIIILSEDHNRLDLDNSAKGILDYLRRIEVIEDDAKKNMRKVTLQWGDAPTGCRVVVRPIA